MINIYKGSENTVPPSSNLILFINSIDLDNGYESTTIFALELNFITVINSSWVFNFYIFILFINFF